MQWQDALRRADCDLVVLDESMATSEPFIYSFIFNVTTHLIYHTICRTCQMLAQLVNAELERTLREIVVA